MEDFVKNLHKAQDSAKKSLEKSAENMKKFADRKRGPTTEYTVGQLVMLDSRNLSTTRPSHKLSDKWEGPFEVLEKIGTHAYKLKLPDTWKHSNTFHVDKLKPYHQDPLHPNHTRPPPDLVNKEEEYEVEKILDCKYRQGILRYLIKWVGYPNTDNIWVRADQAEHMKDLVSEYHKVNPEAPTSLRPTRETPKGPRKRPTRKVGKVRFLGLDPTVSVPLSDITFQKRDTLLVNPIVWPTGRLTSSSEPPPPFTPNRIYTLDKLKVVLITDNAKIPVRSSDNAAGYDLSSAQEVVIPAGEHRCIQTDLSLSLPKGTYGRIAPRSGLALKHAIGVMAGVIDADFTGSVGVILINHGSNDFVIKIGDRIAQLILERIRTPPVITVKDLKSTDRGKSGFGSTGV